MGGGILSCRTPVCLKTAFAVLVQEGGVLLLHGWCAEKENRGKGGSGQGKIGAGVVSCRSMDPVGIPSGSRQDPVRHQFLHIWAPLLASRDPVGIQSGSCRRAPMSGGSQIHKKKHFCNAFARFWLILVASRQVQTRCQKFENWCLTGSRLDPDWIPTGSRLAKSGAQKCKIGARLVPTGSRLDPDWVSSKNTYFLKFEHLFLNF